MKDYYVVLGIPRNESPRGIREAYRQLAKRYHPDRAGPEASTEFRDVGEAYEALSDPDRRLRFDRGLRRAEGRLDVAPDTIVLDDEPPPEPLSPEPVSLMRGFRRMHPSREEILDRVLHNLLPARAPKGEQTVALQTELVLSAAERARGGVVWLDVPVFRGCPACGSSGGGWLYPCATCDGRGVVEREARLRVSIPPRAPDGVVLDVPLAPAGVHNLVVRLRLRVDAGSSL
jgi:molecular chaperone DnaJ